MKKPKLSVVICSGGRPESLKKTLRSLEKQSFKDWEVVVVSLTKVYPLLKGARWVRDSGKGLAVARDLGWRWAKGELVAWIDDDVVLSRDWAKSLVKIFDDHDDVGGVSGPTIVPEELLKNRLIFWWYRAEGWKKPLAWLWVKVLLKGDPYVVGRIYKTGMWSPGSNFKTCLSKTEGSDPSDVDYLEACNMTLRRELVKKVGGFDLGYKGTSEWCEVDLAMRVKELKYRLVFSPKVKLEHHVSRSGVFADRRWLGERLRNFIKFYIRHRL